MSLKEEILTYIKRTDHVSFAELNRIEGFEGDYEFQWRSNETAAKPFGNLVLWANMSKEALDAIDELMASGDIHFQGTTPLIYLVDGCALRLPVAKRLKVYKEPHWLPVCLRPGKGPQKRPQKRRASQAKSHVV